MTQLDRMEVGGRRKLAAGFLHCLQIAGQLEVKFEVKSGPECLSQFNNNPTTKFGFYMICSALACVVVDDK